MLHSQCVSYIRATSEECNRQIEYIREAFCIVEGWHVAEPLRRLNDAQTAAWYGSGSTPYVDVTPEYRSRILDTHKEALASIKAIQRKWIREWKDRKQELETQLVV